MPQRQNASGREDSRLRSAVSLWLGDAVSPFQQSPERGMKGKAQVTLQLGELDSRCWRPKGGVIRGRIGHEPRFQAIPGQIERNKIH